MDSAVLGLYYGDEHVYGSLTMPAMDGHPAYRTLLNFTGAVFLEGNRPATHGVLLPITTDAAQKMLDTYARLQEKVRKHANPFYFTLDGTPNERFEAGWNPRQATNCCHHLLTLCKEAGVPLDYIADDLHVTFDTRQLRTIVNEEVHPSESIAYTKETVGKLKEVYVPGQAGPKLFFFRGVHGQAITHDFGDIKLQRTDVNGTRHEQGIIEYLSHEPPLCVPSITGVSVPARAEKMLETGSNLGISEPVDTSNPCHKR